MFFNVIYLYFYYFVINPAGMDPFTIPFDQEESDCSNKPHYISPVNLVLDRLFKLPMDSKHSSIYICRNVVKVML